MTVTELLNALANYPPNAELGFLCMDGYEDVIEHIEMENGTVLLMGWDRKAEASPVLIPGESYDSRHDDGPDMLSATMGYL